MRPRLRKIVSLIGAPAAVVRPRGQSAADERRGAEEVRRRLDATRARLRERIPPPD